MANSADSDQTAPFGSSLIRVGTVCLSTAVPITSVTMVVSPKINLEQNYVIFVSICFENRVLLSLLAEALPD